MNSEELREVLDGVILPEEVPPEEYKRVTDYLITIGVIDYLFTQKLNQGIGQLRQWLNERPDGSKLLTNEDLEYWLFYSKIKNQKKKEI